MLRPFFPELVMSTDLLSFEHPSVLLFCLKTFPFPIRYNDKTYDFSSNISYYIEWNSAKCMFLLTFARILQNSSKISEKLRSWLFWSSTWLDFFISRVIKLIFLLCFVSLHSNVWGFFLVIRFKDIVGKTQMFCRLGICRIFHNRYRMPYHHMLVDDSITKTYLNI